MTADISLSEDASENLKVSSILTCKEIKPQSTGTLYLIFSKFVPVFSASISLSLGFNVTEGSASYDDEYQLEDIEISISDMFSPLLITSFDKHFESFFTAQDEVTETYQVEYKSLEAAISELIKHFGITVFDGSSKVDIKTEKFHTLKLGGRFLGKLDVIMKCIIGFDNKQRCVVKFVCRCKDQELATNLLESIC